MFSEINNKLQNLRKITDEIIQLRYGNITLKQKITHQNKQIEMLDKEVKRKNLVTQGVADDENEKIEDTEQKVTEIIKTWGSN